MSAVFREAGVTEPLSPRCIFYHPVADEPLDSYSSLRNERGGREGGWVAAAESPRKVAPELNARSHAVETEGVVSSDEEISVSTPYLKNAETTA